MTRDEILNIPAGYEMDALILASVFGVMAFRDEVGRAYKLGAFQENEPVPNYSGDILSAWAVVEKLGGEDSDYGAHIIGSINKTWRCIFSNAFVEFSAMEATAPLAICRAALLTTLED